MTSATSLNELGMIYQQLKMLKIPNFAKLSCKSLTSKRIFTINFSQTFERDIGTNFSYLSIQVTNQVRKNPLILAVTELFLLTKLFL